MSGLTSIIAGSIAATSPSVMERCELHIWTTRNFHAVFHGAEPVYGGIQMYLSPLEDVKHRLAESIDQDSQIEAIKALNLEASGKFAGYKVVYHNALVPGKYNNWLDKGLGVGGRDSESTATCYSEIHVVLITLFRTALSKKIQTVFLFRDFGASSNMVYKVVEAGSTGAPAFQTNGEPKNAAAQDDVRAAFQENLRIFLKKKKMLRPRQS